MLQTLFKSTLLLTVAQMTQRLGTVALTFVISRWLGAAELGVYATAMAVYGLLTLASGLGAKSYLVREIAQHPEQTARYLQHIGVLGLGVSGVLVMIGWGVVMVGGFSAELSNAIFIVLIALPAAVLNSFLQSTFIAHQRVVFITYALFILNIIKVGVSAVLLWNGGTAIVVLVALVVGEWVTLLFNFAFLLRSITRFSWQINRSFFGEMIGELKTFALLSLLAGLFAQPEVLLISWVMGEEAVGYFAASYKLITLWLIVPQVTMTNVFPYLARAYSDGEQDPMQMQTRSVRYLLLVSLPIALGMMALAEPIIHLFYGDGYDQAVRPLQIMALLVPLNALVDVSWRILAARHQQHLDLQVRLLMTVFRFGIGVACIQLWGINGAAVAALVSLAVTLLFMLGMVKRGGKQLPIVQANWRIFLISGVMALFVIVMRSMVPFLILLVMAVLFYSSLLLVGSVLPEREMYALWRVSFGRNNAQ